MNYAAVARICCLEVQKTLMEHVSGSEATCFYLKLMFYITSSFTEKNLTPLERLYRIWYAVFSLRYWRNKCALVNIDDPKTKTRWNSALVVDLALCSSQSCESFFKGIRATSPVGSTQTNVTVADFMNRAAKIPDQNGEMRIIKKSSIVWFLEEGVRRLSNDRNFRVRHSAPYVERAKLILKVVERRKERKKEKATVLWDWEEGTPNVGVLRHWYIFEQNGRDITGLVEQIQVFSHRFYPINNDTYICSVPSPNYKDERVTLPSHVIDDLRKYLTCLY